MSGLLIREGSGFIEHKYISAIQFKICMPFALYLNFINGRGRNN
jgi:hypothetical protein